MKMQFSVSSQKTQNNTKETFCVQEQKEGCHNEKTIKSYKNF